LFFATLSRTPFAKQYGFTLVILLCPATIFDNMAVARAALIGALVAAGLASTLAFSAQPAAPIACRAATSCRMAATKKGGEEPAAASIRLDGMGLAPWTAQALFTMAAEPLSQGWKRHDSAVLGLMVFSPEAQLLKENAARAASLRSKMRKRIRRTRSQLADMTATLVRGVEGYDQDGGEGVLEHSM
jgi:hypothetical protein